MTPVAKSSSDQKASSEPDDTVSLPTVSKNKAPETEDQVKAKMPTHADTTHSLTATVPVVRVSPLEEVSEVILEGGTSLTDDEALNDAILACQLPETAELRAEEPRHTEPFATWRTVGARMSGLRKDVSEVGAEQGVSAPQTPTPSLRPASTEEDRGSEPRLSGEKYVGYSFIFARILAVISIISLAFSFYSISRSLKNALHMRDFSISPSFPLLTGACANMRWRNTLVHLAVNVLGSIIVGISTYLQQLCTSPSYKDIQEVIKPEGGDIQFGSILPLALLRRRRRGPFFVWLLLLATTLPVHLTLNSAMGYSYTVLSLQNAVIRLDEITTSGIPQFNWNNSTPISWTNVTALECQTFLEDFTWSTDVADIIVVVNNTGSTNFQDYLYSSPNQTFVTQYNPNTSYIEYCYENRVTPQCSITVRWAPLLVFSCSVFIKFAVVLISFRSLPHFKQSLYNSIGDLLDLAIKNIGVFIPTGECLLDSDSISQKNVSSAIRARRRRVAWWQLMGIWDWLFYTNQLVALGAALFAVYDSTVSYLPLYATKSIFTVYINSGFGVPFKILWEFQLFGVLNSTQLLGLIFVVNLPQLWFSIGVLFITNHVTRIRLESEWRRYYLRLRRPRVSCSTDASGRYIRKPQVLGLPYPLTILTLIAGATGHWLISEAFFTVETNGTIQEDNQTFQYSMFWLTHSPGPIALDAFIWFIVTLVITTHLVIGKWTWMPIMNGSVRVVLASCVKLTSFPAAGIAWGDVSDKENERIAGFGGIVKPLVAGELYSESIPKKEGDQNQSQERSTAKSEVDENFSAKEDGERVTLERVESIGQKEDGIQ